MIQAPVPCSTTFLMWGTSTAIARFTTNCISTELCFVFNLNSNYYKKSLKISLWKRFLFLNELTLFLLFCNGKATCLNPSRPVGGSIFLLMSYLLLTTNSICGKVFRTYTVHKAGRTCNKHT